MGAKLTWDSGNERWNLTGPMKYVLDYLINDEFNYTLVRATDKEWGMYQLGNQTWTGIKCDKIRMTDSYMSPEGSMGLLHRNECDLALGPIALTYQRSLVSPYTTELFAHEMSILSAYLRSDVDILKPVSHFLNHYLWNTLLVFLFILSVVLSVSNIFHSNDSPMKAM